MLEVQYCIYHRGCLIGRADLAFPERRLAVEYDGVWHGAPLQVGQDRDRLNRLHAAGWEVVFITAQASSSGIYVRAALEGRQAA